MTVDIHLFTWASRIMPQVYEFSCPRQWCCAALEGRYQVANPFRYLVIALNIVSSSSRAGINSRRRTPPLPAQAYVYVSIRPSQHPISSRVLSLKDMSSMYILGAVSLHDAATSWWDHRNLLHEITFSLVLPCCSNLKL